MIREIPPGFGEAYERARAAVGRFARGPGETDERFRELHGLASENATIGAVLDQAPDRFHAAWKGWDELGGSFAAKSELLRLVLGWIDEELIRIRRRKGW